MKFLDWILEYCPGALSELENRFEIEHKSGDFSTVFKGTSEQDVGSLAGLGDVYVDYDGADLFSSTFKVCSVRSAQEKNGVKLVESLASLEAYASEVHASFPEEAIPFMSQAGIGIYALGIHSGRIYEWDSEEQAITGAFGDLPEIFKEWLAAVR